MQESLEAKVSLRGAIATKQSQYEIASAPSGPRNDDWIEPMDKGRPFIEHLEELRRRLLRALLWVALATGFSFRFAQPILTWFLQPVGQVVFLSPAEPFLVTLKVAFLSGLFLSSPLLAWEVWSFLKPALFPQERWGILWLVPMSGGLFLLGAWFGWQILLPAALTVLLSFGSSVMTPMLTVGGYVGFAGSLLLASGLVFQIPIVVLFLVRVGVLHPGTLLRQWRMAAVAVLVAAAVLTPTPDVVTQLLLAAPMGLLYLLSVLLSFLVAR